MIPAFIFDMDGVVIDSHPVHRRSWSLFLDSIGKQVSEQELDYVMEGTKREDILRHFLGSLTERQLNEYGAQKEALFRQQAIDIQPMPGFLEFIDRVTDVGIRAALASSASEHRVNYILENLGIRHHFSVIVTGNDVTNGKPDPSVFLLAAERLGVLASEAVVFEDAVAGVKAAKAAGMRCLGVAQGARSQVLQEAGAEYVVPDFAGLTTNTLENWFSQ